MAVLSDITIIIPTRNEADNILPFLATIPEQTPLIVVDDSDDATPYLIRNHRPRRTQLLRRSSNVTQARQIGADTAVTPWLLFSDADVVFAPGYFPRLLQILETGDHVFYGPKRSRNQFRSYYHRFAQGQRLSHRLGIPAASGSNLLVQRRAFRAVGGFDLDLTCNEDSEIVWRLKRQGYRVHFVPDLIVYATDHRRLHRGLWRKTAHSLLRCLLLWSGLMPRRWRRSDWGYWSQERKVS
jgi:GT2 family glycosyltransferase